jgi:hypothetical protein
MCHPYCEASIHKIKKKSKVENIRNKKKIFRFYCDVRVVCFVNKSCFIISVY